MKWEVSFGKYHNQYTGMLSTKALSQWKLTMVWEAFTHTLFQDPFWQCVILCCLSIRDAPNMAYQRVKVDKMGVEWMDYGSIPHIWRFRVVGQRNYWSETVGHAYMNLALLVNKAKEDGATGSNLVHKTQDSKGNLFTKVPRTLNFAHQPSSTVTTVVILYCFLGTIIHPHNDCRPQSLCTLRQEAVA